MWAIPPCVWGDGGIKPLFSDVLVLGVSSKFIVVGLFLLFLMEKCEKMIILLLN